jgi:drug/metabolite transporter (DMT)-like permease
VGIFLALLAAICFAVATYLQFEAASSVGEQFVLRPALIVRLLGDLRFGIGTLFDISGGVLQFFALKYGDVTTVMPLLSIGFVLAVALERIESHQRGRGREMAIVIAVGLALALFLVAAPTPRATQPDQRVLLLMVVPATLLGLGALTLFRGWLSTRPPLQALLGGLLLGAVAVLERAVGEMWSLGGIRVLLTSTALWSLIIVGALALIIVQSSFNGSKIQAQLPLVSATEAFSAVALSFIFLGLGTLSVRVVLLCLGTLTLEALGIWYLHEPGKVVENEP